MAKLDLPRALAEINQLLSQLRNTARLITFQGKNYKLNTKTGSYEADGKSFTKAQLRSKIEGQHFSAPRDKNIKIRKTPTTKSKGGPVKDVVSAVANIGVDRGMHALYNKISGKKTTFKSWQAMQNALKDPKGSWVVKKSQVNKPDSKDNKTTTKSDRYVKVQVKSNGKTITKWKDTKTGKTYFSKPTFDKDRQSRPGIIGKELTKDKDVNKRVKIAQKEGWKKSKTSGGELGVKQAVTQAKKLRQNLSDKDKADIKKEKQTTNLKNRTPTKNVQTSKDREDINKENELSNLRIKQVSTKGGGNNNVDIKENLKVKNKKGEWGDTKEGKEAKKAFMKRVKAGKNIAANAGMDPEKLWERRKQYRKFLKTNNRKIPSSLR